MEMSSVQMQFNFEEGEKKDVLRGEKSKAAK